MEPPDDPASGLGVVMVAPVLAPDVCMFAAALWKAGRLHRIVTRWTFTKRELAWLERAWPRSRLARRSVSPVPRAGLVRVPLADASPVVARLLRHDLTDATDRSFALVDRRASRLVGPRNQAVFGREDCCLRSFTSARAGGVPTVYHLPTAYCEFVKEITLREYEKFPEAFPPDAIKTEFAETRMKRKAAELAAADYVLCPSTFVRTTVEAAGVSGNRVKTIPLGIDTRLKPAHQSAREKTFLYAGNISARKGVHRLLRLWKALGAHRTHKLRLIGDMQLPALFLSDYKGVYEAVPRLPRERLMDEYSRAQAFVFNAVADGFGHVFAEAMNCGTAVLCSRNSGAPDIVTDGVEGRLFDYGDNQLGEVLEWSLGHPSQLMEMGRQAGQRAQTWGEHEFAAAFVSWIASI